MTPLRAGEPCQSAEEQPHRCPAYVVPAVLGSSSRYCGRPARRDRDSDDEDDDDDRSAADGRLAPTAPCACGCATATIFRSAFPPRAIVSHAMPRPVRTAAADRRACSSTAIPAPTSRTCVDLRGQPYRQLSTAFLYRTEYVPQLQMQAQPVGRRSAGAASLVRAGCRQAQRQQAGCRGARCPGGQGEARPVGAACTGRDARRSCPGDGCRHRRGAGGRRGPAVRTGQTTRSGAWAWVPAPPREVRAEPRSVARFGLDEARARPDLLRQPVLRRLGCSAAFRENWQITRHNEASYGWLSRPHWSLQGCACRAVRRRIEGAAADGVVRAALPFWLVLLALAIQPAGAQGFWIPVRLRAAGTLPRPAPAATSALPPASSRSTAVRPLGNTTRRSRMSRGSTYRTLCVRMCDGFYFPISYATSSATSRATPTNAPPSCGSDARLFYHPNPGGDVEAMLDMTGRAYASYPTAFKYRKTLVQGCQCRPQPWTEAELARHRAYAGDADGSRTADAQAGPSAAPPTFYRNGFEISVPRAPESYSAFDAPRSILAFPHRTICAPLPAPTPVQRQPQAGQWQWFSDTGPAGHARSRYGWPGMR